MWRGEVNVADSVVVPCGKTLTVEPGSTIRFARGAALVVHGKLVAAGEPSRPIHFLLERPDEPGAWKGIIIGPRNVSAQPTTAQALTIQAESLQGACSIIHCRIEHAEHGVSLIDAAGRSHRIANCTIEACPGTGVRLIRSSDAIIEHNQIAHCGTQEQAPAGGIWLEDANRVQVRHNTLRDNTRYGVFLDASRLTNVCDNRIQNVGGKPQSTGGYGISLNESSRNLIERNEIDHANYLCLGVSNSDENLIVGNRVGDSPDGIALAGPKTVGNLVRDNLIERCYWSQLYITSQARDNRIERTNVRGGDGAITSWAAGPNLFEDCRFEGTGPVALLGTSLVTLRRVSVVGCRGPHDLWTEFEPTCQVIDCEIDKRRIDFSKGTTANSHFVWLHSLRVRVVDPETDTGIDGATVRLAGPTANSPITTTTRARGLATLELVAGVVRKDKGFEPHPAWSLTVVADGFEPAEVEAISNTEATRLTVRLKRR